MSQYAMPTTHKQIDQKLIRFNNNGYLNTENSIISMKVDK